MISPSHFRPRQWFTNKHVQTILAAAPGYAYVPSDAHEEHLTIPVPNTDENLHAVAWWRHAPGPAVLILHGVGGSSDSAYVRRAAHALTRAGYHAIALDSRGAGKGADLSSSLYHAGLVGDIHATICDVKDKPRVTTLGILGISLGGQAGLLLAAHWGHDIPKAVRALVTISAPYDLTNTCKRMDANPFLPYRGYILRGLINNALRLKRRLPHRIALSVADIKALRRVWDYDDQIIAPMHGFTGASHYYSETSCGPHLGRIGLPTLSIHAMDDPIVPADTLEPFRAKASSAVQFNWVPRGGHVGFVSNLAQLRCSWAVHEAIAYFRQHVG